MIIQNPLPPEKTITEWEFMLTNGTVLAYTLNPSDTISIGDKIIQLHLLPRKALSENTLASPEEFITLLVPHVIAFFHRERIVQDLSPVHWAEMIKENSTVQ